MIIDCISDLHGHFPELNGGDLLILAGDLTCDDTVYSWDKFYKWLEKQKYRKIIYIGGNHDNFLTQCASSAEQKLIGIHDDTLPEYLFDTGTTFEGYKIWGSPWTASFPGINQHCTAFTLPFGCDTEQHLDEYWQLIPHDIDILITHSPPYGILDTNQQGQNCGSMSLTYKIFNNIKRLKLHVFGHIHESYGQNSAWEGGNPATRFINASHVNERYEPVNKPVKVIL